VNPYLAFAKQESFHYYYGISFRMANRSVQTNAGVEKPKATQDSINDNDGKGKESGAESPPAETRELSRAEKLKRAVKDYGATVIVFHVTMSLCSLGLSYLLVSR